MTTSLEDRLTFHVCWKGDSMSVREMIEFTKAIVLELEKTSPLRRPFDATGEKRELSNLEIASDLSDFEEIVLKTMASKYVKFVKTPDDGDYTVSLDSISYGACSIDLSDYPDRKSNHDSILDSVTFSITANSRKSNNVVHGLGVQVPRFLENEVNEAWGRPGVARGVVEFLIRFLDPVYCYVTSSRKRYSIVERGVDFYELGLQTYTSNAKFVEVLNSLPDVRRYMNGVLVDFGDAVSDLDDPEVRKKMLRIRDHLRNAGARNWLEID